MLLKLLRFIFGYVLVEVNGFAPERLMNLLMKDNIVIWNVIETKDGYRFFIGRKNLLNIKTYLQKTNIKLKIINRIGLPYYFKKNKRRAMFAVGSLMFIISIYILSLFVWEIKVTGEDHLIGDEIIKHIEKKYIPLGTLKSKVDCAILESNLRKDFDEISWISCELKGTELTIHLEEGKEPDKSATINETGDIIAKRNAVITKMITRQGTPVTKIGDKVKKGDILISGTVYIYDDNNEILETSYITADGDVYGKTSYKYKDFVELNYYEKEYLEDVKKHITFFFMDYCLTPFLPSMSAKKYDTYTQMHKLRLFNNFYLPIGYKKVIRTPYTLKNKTRTKEEAEKMLKERLDKKIKYLEKNGLEIIKNDVKIEKNENRIEAAGNITVIESIARLRKTGERDE